MTFHPWRRLRSRDHLTVEWTPQPLGRIAATDGRNIIYMDPRLSQVQRRCAITHEQVHIDLGHTGGCDSRDEAKTREITARLLIDMGDLLSAYRWAEHLDEVADELWVTPQVLRDRIDNLTRDELRQLVALYKEVERGC